MNTTPSSTVQITNDTTSPSVVLDAYDPSKTPSGEQVYGLPLIARKTTSGASILAAGESATVQLDPSRILYDLIFARPADLFPLQNSSLLQGIISGTYPSITVKGTSPAQLMLALQFYINILVYPTSKVAQGYYAAVSSAANSASSADSIDDKIDAFFQTTQNYKSLTLNAVVTAQSYARAFAFVWAGFSNDFASFGRTITYYLYSTGTAASNSNKGAPNVQGTLTLTRKSDAPNPADPTDRAGGYSIVYTDPSGNNTTMSYANGQIVSDASDFPAIALTGSFVLKSTLTNNASDNVIIPMLTGAVHGTQVVGTTVKQSSDGNSSSDFWAFFHPKTMGQWFELITTFLGLAMGIDWIGSKAKSALDWFRGRNRPPTPSEIEQMRRQLDELADQVRQNQQELLDRLGNREAQVPAEANIPQAQVDGQAQAVEANNVARADAQIDQLEAQANQVEVLAEYGVDQQLEQAAEQIRDNVNDLQEAQDAGGNALQEAVNNGAEHIPNIQNEIQQVQENLGNQINEQDRAALEEARQVQEEAHAVEEQAEEAAEDASEGEGAEGDAPIEGGLE